MDKKIRKVGRPKKRIEFSQIPEETVKLILDTFYQGGDNGDHALSRRLDIEYAIILTVTTHEMNRLKAIMRRKGRIIK